MDKDHILRGLLIGTSTTSQQVFRPQWLWCLAPTLGPVQLLKTASEARKPGFARRSGADPSCRKEMKQKSSWFSVGQIYQFHSGK